MQPVGERNPKQTPAKTVVSLAMNRRSFIRSRAASSLVMPGMLSSLMAEAEVRPPHARARAKRVIFLHMSGGVSHVDSFDYKPRLFSDHNAPYAVPQKMLDAFAPENRSAVKFYKKPDWAFKQRGQSGLWMSELFPETAARADDICLVRSMFSDNADHQQATLGIHTGSVGFTRPSMGSWVTYGLGSENANLPGFMVLAPVLPYSGPQLWSSDFLPGRNQGTHVIPGPEPLPNVRRRIADAAEQEAELGLAAALNRRHLLANDNDPKLAARISAFETAFRMQTAAPEAFDLSKENDATHALYGLPRGSTKGFAWQCLMARRLAERGVRFIELIDTGASNNWDSHGDMAQHGPLAKNVDRPIGALLTDLRQRGMLEDTLVVWATEFGRTPFNTGKDAKGREHHAQAFTCWMAGGGVKGGIAYGQTDEFGNTIVENPVHIHDLHATILHLLGLDHKALTYRHAGRDYRLTDVHGNVLHDVVA